MDPFDNISVKILGYSVKTRWQISLNYLIPCTAELLVFIIVMVVDGALIYQHMLDENYIWAWYTLGIIIIPALLTLICILASDQWPIESGFGSEKRKFFAAQLLNFTLFPACATYRFSRKIFWCVESLFHAKNTYERHHAVAKAAETSPFELYHFLQSFFHCAPQIILQLFILLRDDMFRNYDTAFIQVLSVTFCLIKMSMSAESYQRFESQKIVGKSYPWLSPHQIQIHSTTFRRTLSAPGGINNNNNNNTASAVNNHERSQEGIRKSLNVNINNFNERDRSGEKEEMKKIDFVSNITDDDKINSRKNIVATPDEIDTNFPSTSAQRHERNVPDDDLLDNIDEIKEYLKRTADEMEEIDSPIVLRNHNENFDRIPSMAPPQRPQSTKHPYLGTLNRISTFKDP